MVTEVHVVCLGPLGERDSFENSVEQFVFDLGHCVAVQHLHGHLCTSLALRGIAHQSLGQRQAVRRPKVKDLISAFLVKCLLRTFMTPQSTK